MAGKRKSDGYHDSIYRVDPYAHQVCTDKKRTMQSWISAASTGHMFRATPRNPKAKIEIRVTDRFGKVYQQNVSK